MRMKITLSFMHIIFFLYRDVMCMVNKEIQTQINFDIATHGGLKILDASFKLQMLFLNNMLSSLKTELK